jgi:GntR family transcriptional regulator, gluconate operon transcriptional repressor
MTTDGPSAMEQTPNATGDTRLEPLEAPRSLAEDAADRIREQILGGGFRQGDHLVETRIAEELNISRGPVREAFKLLRAEGLLQEEPRRGSFVVRLGPDDVREIYVLRAAIEGRAARAISADGNESAVARLRDLLDRLDAAVGSGDASAVFAADLAFHRELVRSARNARLDEVFTRYVPTLGALLRLDEHVYGTLDDIATEHRSLVSAIEEADADRAASLAEAHCDQAGELVASYLESVGEPGEPRQ